MVEQNLIVNFGSRGVPKVIGEIKGFTRSLLRLWILLKMIRGQMARPIPATGLLGSRVIDVQARSVTKLASSFVFLRRSINAWSRTFSGWALSLLFFGMLIFRVFSSIAKTGLKTFKDIMGAQSAQVRGLARLEAGWTFLKFSIGNAIATALLPLIPAIIDVISRIAEWINANPKLTAKIIGWGIAIGVALFVIGSLVLGIKALIFVLSSPVILGAAAVFIGIGAGAIAFQNDTVDAVTKVGGVLAAFSLIVLGVAIMFASWPIALFAAIVLMLGFFLIFRKRIINGWKIIGISFLIWAHQMELDFTDTLFKMSQSVTDFVNAAISALNSILPKSKKIGKIDLIRGKQLRAHRMTILQQQKALFDRRRELAAEVKDDTIANKFKEIFMPGFNNLKKDLESSLGITGGTDAASNLAVIDKAAGKQTNVTINGGVNIVAPDATQTGQDAVTFAEDFAREIKTVVASVEEE
ncbi:hypothetical protein CMI37_29260 [Candidatus Pacearchaeota archaeon]|jgi:hypothetical protein|nr:hypothetical protein [Candidatus Pacearchaeota archaeon]|tara:strand:- start:1820 stop:3223 length:1404 start_codon:yes stop_codon:yes gene_type:complete